MPDRQEYDVFGGMFLLPSSKWALPEDPGFIFFIEQQRPCLWKIGFTHSLKFFIHVKCIPENKYIEY